MRTAKDRSLCVCPSKVALAAQHARCALNLKGIGEFTAVTPETSDGTWHFRRPRRRSLGSLCRLWCTPFPDLYLLATATHHELTEPDVLVHSIV